MKKKNKKEDKIKLINISKIRFAIEIEVEFPHSKDSQKLIDRNRVLKGWYIEDDGSLESGAEYKPKKNNKLYLNEEGLTQIKEILALIRVHRGKISNRCGLHIHCDMSKFSDKKILEIIREWVHRQKFIMKKFKVHPDRIDQYCQLLPKENLQKLTIKQIHDFRNSNGEWNFSNYTYLDSKYYSLNATHLQKEDFNTLEFRIFNGTLKFKELKERIEFCLNFIKDACERE